MNLTPTEYQAMLDRNPALARANAPVVKKSFPTTDESSETDKVSLSLERRENDLHDHVYTWLTQHRGLVVGHARTDKKSTFTVGWPDLTFAINGRACAIELKTTNGELTEAQASIIADMEMNGWTVKVCRNLQEVREFVLAIANL